MESKAFVTRRSVTGRTEELSEALASVSWSESEPHGSNK